MKVFVTGATGYVGSAVAMAFRRAGHDVWGLARSEEKAQRIARHEIRPVIGSMDDPTSYLAAAKECSVLIHTAADTQSPNGPELDKRTVDALLGLAGEGARPKTFIYTSGVWVHGNTGGVVDETAPLSPPSLVAHRPGFEQGVLNSSGMKTVVIRPGCVYGGRGGLTGLWFGPAASGGPVSVVGDGFNRWAMVHVHDLADGYLRAAERGVGGEAFDLTDDSRLTVGEMATAAARAAGYRGNLAYVPLEEALKTLGPFAGGLALDQQIDSGKAQRLLGWRPHHKSFVAGIEGYYIAWKALQG